MLASMIVWKLDTWTWGKGFEFEILSFILDMMIIPAENALTMSAWGLQNITKMM